MTDDLGAATAHELRVGDDVELEIGRVGHGGICVARLDGRVVFVRYALPGERAVVRITEVRAGSFCRGEAMTIIRPDARRVRPPCAHFGPGGCGGCDFQHADPALQRELKAAVVAEQLRRLAGIERTVEVEPLPGGGFGWRSRVRWAVEPAAGLPGGGGSADDAVIGPRRYRSHAVVPISADEPCLIAAPGLSEAAAALRPPSGASEVVVLARGAAPPAVAWLPGEPPRSRTTGAGPAAAAQPRNRSRRGPAHLGAAGAGAVVEHSMERAFLVAPTGFWQPHRRAADALCGAVGGALDGGALDGGALDGGTAWDLYGGVGLFAVLLAERVGRGGRVITVERDREASALAARNVRDLPQVHVLRARVDEVLMAAASPAPGAARPAAAPGLDGPVAAVVLDPPRSGAGAAVCRAIAAREPAVIVYVACDPAALARDTAALGRSGYRLDTLRAFDAFPQTHHVECVARFLRGVPDSGGRHSSPAARRTALNPDAPTAR